MKKNKIKFNWTEKDVEHKITCNEIECLIKGGKSEWDTKLDSVQVGVRCKEKCDEKKKNDKIKE